jgi:hypothetical protein
MDCSKGEEELSVWWNVGRGLSACRTASILSKTAGARDETFVFLQRLNRMACIDG